MYCTKDGRITKLGVGKMGCIENRVLEKGLVVQKTQKTERPKD